MLLEGFFLRVGCRSMRTGMCEAVRNKTKEACPREWIGAATYCSVLRNYVSVLMFSLKELYSLRNGTCISRCA